MDKTYNISIPTDNQGMAGRECPKCEKYFKLKPGTGLPTSECHCPYCCYKGHSNEFYTKEQIEYAKSIVMNDTKKQIMNSIGSMFKSLEKETKGSLIQFKVNSNSYSNFPIKWYNEKELETQIVCDNCKLEFAIYGVFANCPDCKRLNAFTIFNKSLEAARKMLEFITNNNFEDNIKDAQLKMILSECVSSFDGLGKALRLAYPKIFPIQPKNLFQNFLELSSVLKTQLNIDLSEVLEDYSFDFKMFQVRHINEHNMGVIDDNFAKKVPSLNHLIGRKYKVAITEISAFIEDLYKISDLFQISLNRIDK
ncbi:MAG: hypothetical protein NTY74_16410 [Ignavibacteriae bacterium]|nr:hypothetical protein [Ignavibacteriota bacterium]